MGPVVTPSEQPIRVLMLARAVYPLHGFGGIERHVFHLVTHLVRQGVDVMLVAGRPPDGTDQQTSRQQILEAARLGEGPLALQFLKYDLTSPILRPNSIIGRQIKYPIFSLREGRLARGQVQAELIDVVHSQGLCAFGYAWERQLRRTLHAVPFIANPHGLEEYRAPDWRKRLAYAPFRALYSWGHRKADRVIATDAVTQDDLPKYLGVAHEQVVVIPSAIDVEECLGCVDEQQRARFRERFELGAADPVLLSVGRLERNKGYHVLIEALALVRDVLGSAWRWLLVGQGKEEAALRQQATQLGLNEQIVFVGKLSDTELHSLYEAVDLFVHPTLYEGSSLVTLEAMIHRLPVVGTAAGGIPDKVFPGRNGLLVPPGDTAGLAKALWTAIELRGQWQRWGEEGARIVESTFAWPIVAKRTKQEYERMLAKRRSS